MGNDNNPQKEKKKKNFIPEFWLDVLEIANKE